MEHNSEKITIHTERLLVRNFTGDDYEDLYEYLSDSETYRFEPGEPISIETAIKLCNERSKSNAFLAVQLDNKVIGHVYFDQTDPKELMTWEAGYIFNRKYHGKGYATESLKSIIDYGFKHFNIHRIVAHCSPDNAPSWKLLERVKMKREGLLRKNIFFRKNSSGEPMWLDTYEYGLLESDL